jgi:hypothetical protein
MRSLVVSIEYGFTGDQLPESHGLHDFDGLFFVQAKVYPRRHATYYFPAEGGDVEIQEIELLKPSVGHERRLEIEALFSSLIDDDANLEDTIYEALGTEFLERHQARAYEG